MNLYQIIHCPNCGDRAERCHATETNTVRTSCHFCDYLLVLCTKTGKVIESYAPGLFPFKMQFEMPSVARRQHPLLNRENSVR